MEKIVILTDPPRTIEYVNLARHDMDGYTPMELKKTREAINSFARSVLYTDAETFLRRLWLHKRDLIFPMIWGRGARNTKAILPAICEAKHIDYIGADAYTHTLCYDKYLSKKYAEAFGFKTPRGAMLFRAQPIGEIVALLKCLPYPAIIKPNFGGGSCGISAQNLVDTYETAFSLTNALFESGYDPLLVEEYIPGHELSILMLGNQTEVIYFGEAQLILDGETFFLHKIWGYESKKLESDRSHYQISSLLPKSEHEKAKALFLSLPKAEYLRIDGRENEDGFFVLELSPDCYLGPDSDFCTLFEHQGKSHADLLRFLAENARSASRMRNTPIT